MSKHTFDFSAATEKDLAILCAAQGNTQTPDEYALSSFQPAMDNWSALAREIVKAPIVDELEKAIASGNDAKVQAVKDALGVAKVEAATAVAVK